MIMHKQHVEFAPVDREVGWEPAPGYPEGSGVLHKILSGALDESAGRGSRTRLLRFPERFHTRAPFVHSYWEEVLLLEGDLWVGNDSQGDGGERFAPLTYACRPPGIHHGPFKSVGGCLLLEFHDYR